MSAGCLRRMLSPWRQVHILLSHRCHPSSLGEPGRGSTCSAHAHLCSKVASGSDVRSQPSRQKQDPRARQTISSIGRKIHQRHLQVVGASGEDLGTMHRADVIRLMDQEGLKLVPVELEKEPPVYRLMTGKQIHEEQLKLREKEKAKAGPVVLKELAFSTDISLHDLNTKLRQVQSWLERKHHVRVTLRSRGGQPEKPLDMELERMVQGMDFGFGFVSRPQVIRDGKVAMCILRVPSKKELRQTGVAQKGNPPSPQAPENASLGMDSPPQQ